MTNFHIIDVTRWVKIALLQLSLLRNNFFLFLVAISSNSSLFESKVFWEWRKIKIVLNYLLAKCSFVCAVKNAKCCRHVAHKEKLHMESISQIWKLFGFPAIFRKLEKNIFFLFQIKKRSLKQRKRGRSRNNCFAFNNLKYLSFFYKNKCFVFIVIFFAFLLKQKNVELVFICWIDNGFSVEKKKKN